MLRLNRGRGAHRGIYLGAAGALAIALTGCGGGAGAASTAMPSAAAQSPFSTQPSVPAQGSPAAQGSTSAAGPAPAAGGGGTGTASGSGSTAANPPTASIGNVTLSWVAPTENVDGSPLTNLAGYDIHYGTASGKYTRTIRVSNPGIATYVVSDLTPGTYYFSVNAVNLKGTESPMSREVSTTVN